MPQGKPAGVPCVQLDAQQRCLLFGDPRRPAVCASLQPDTEMCGQSRNDAMRFLALLEASTAPHVILRSASRPGAVRVWPMT